MRYLVCLVVGLLFGAIAASMLVGALSRRDAWPRAVMTVMQHELGAARNAVQAGTCQGEASRAAHARLELLATDIERSVLPPGTRDRVFSQYADQLATAIAAWDPGAGCAEQASRLAAVAQACDACHRDYR
ncbi:MAG: hypothetical protein J0H15_00500 [Xanthomonadales bacterium]|nr:hypothetical protein [Xanthomonadales bacterium]